MKNRRNERDRGLLDASGMQFVLDEQGEKSAVRLSLPVFAAWVDSLNWLTQAHTVIGQIEQTELLSNTEDKDQADRLRELLGTVMEKLTDSLETLDDLRYIESLTDKGEQQLGLDEVVADLRAAGLLSS